MNELLKLDGLSIHELEVLSRDLQQLQEQNDHFLDNTILGSCLLRLEVIVDKTMIAKMKDQFHSEIFYGGTHEQTEIC